MKFKNRHSDIVLIPPKGHFDRCLGPEDPTLPVTGEWF